MFAHEAEFARHLQQADSSGDVHSQVITGEQAIERLVMAAAGYVLDRGGQLRRSVV